MALSGSEKVSGGGWQGNKPKTFTAKAEAGVTPGILALTLKMQPVLKITAGDRDAIIRYP